MGGGGAPSGIESGPITTWLSAQFDWLEPPLDFEPIVGGNSNLTYRVTDANGTALALRRPPLGRVLDSAHDMAREYRVISAIGATAVPVPPALALCTDESVIGADFYVMDFVEGLVPHDAVAGGQIPEAERIPLSRNAVEVLASLHAVDPDQVGLGDLGRREDYIGRQLRRWSRQWENSKQREIPAMEQVAEILTATIPVQRRTTIVHGDYRLGNMIVGESRVLALLDWELCTLGDPLADLGYLANAWLAPDEPSTWRDAATQAGGFADRDDVIAYYGELTGADLSDIGYYRAFQHWRMAAILEGVYARYRHGAMGDMAGIDLVAMADAIVRLAHDALDHAG